LGKAEKRALALKSTLSRSQAGTLDPRGKAREYVEAAEDLLEEAREELERAMLGRWLRSSGGRGPCPQA